jgi:hypothetical protein
VADKGNWDRFISQYCVCSVNFVPPTFHTHLQQNTTVIRGNNGRSLDAFKATIFQTCGWAGQTSISHVLMGCCRRPRQVSCTQLQLQRGLNLGVIKRYANTPYALEEQQGTMKPQEVRSLSKDSGPTFWWLELRNLFL